MAEKKHIMLVGGGKMGSAMIAGWIKSGFPAKNISVIETAKPIANRLRKYYGVSVYQRASQVKAKPDIVIFAVKPQIMSEVLPLYSNVGKATTVYLSIAAGKDLEFLQAKLKGKKAIIRAMPNLPATIRKGISVLVANNNTDRMQRAFCEDIMEAVGEVEWIKNENMLDAVTAVSGSGPAYLLSFMEHMVEAARKAGIPNELALKLVVRTIEGTARLARKSENPLHELRKQVTSPGGTTEAGLAVLNKGDVFNSLINKTISAAKKRSKELSK